MSYSCNACGRYITDWRSCDCYSPNPPTPAEIDILRAQLAQAEKALADLVEHTGCGDPDCCDLAIRREQAIRDGEMVLKELRAAHGAERGREGA